MPTCPSPLRLTVGLCLLAGLASLPAAELQLASDVWSPFTDREGRTRIALDIAHEALERAGIQARTTIVSTPALAKEVRSGQVDGSAAYWRDSERETYLHFTRPYLENRLVLVGRADSDVSAGTLSELGGKRVGLVAGYAYGAAVDHSEAPVFVYGDDQQTNLDRLLAGEVDYVLMDQIVVKHLQEHQADEVGRHLAIGKLPLLRRGLHLALHEAVEGAGKLIDDFDAAILAMRADGTFNRLLGLEWVQADIDADGTLDWIHGGGAWSQTPPLDAYRLTTPTGTDKTLQGRVKVGGQLYDSWRDVPRYTGETAPGGTDVDEREFFRFKFKEF